MDVNYVIAAEEPDFDEFEYSEDETVAAIRDYYDFITVSGNYLWFLPSRAHYSHPRLRVFCTNDFHRRCILTSLN